MTDVQRVLQLFRTSHGKLISNSTVLEGQYYGTKQILNWSARITDARDLIGCNCGIDQTTCQATEHIRNVKKNWYQYINDKQEVVKAPAHVWVNVSEVEQKLAELRKQYVTAPKWRRTVIEMQAKALKRSLELQMGLASEVQSKMEALL